MQTWSDLKDHMAQFKDAYLAEDHSHMSIKVKFVEAIESYPIKNDQNKILCAMDRCYDQTTCKKETQALPSCSQIQGP